MGRAAFLGGAGRPSEAGEGAGAWRLSWLMCGRSSGPGLTSPAPAAAHYPDIAGTWTEGGSATVATVHGELCTVRFTLLAVHHTLLATDHRVCTHVLLVWYLQAGQLFLCCLWRLQRPSSLHGRLGVRWTATIRRKKAWGDNSDDERKGGGLTTGVSQGVFSFLDSRGGRCQQPSADMAAADVGTPPSRPCTNICCGHISDNILLSIWKVITCLFVLLRISSFVCLFLY